MSTLCRNPFIKDGFPFGCGNCMPCRLKRRRHWTHRILLESMTHQHNAFITLTYNDEKMPRLEDGRGTLVRNHAALFLKRLRYNISASPIDSIRSLGSPRYFVVGEYGTKTHRPHYHMALFNYRPCWRYSGSMFDKHMTCCPQCDLLYKSWNSPEEQGFVHSGRITVRSAAYISSYTTKKMTKADDQRLQGRYPEFAQPSLRPGLGADYMHEVASTILQFDLDKREDFKDVPHNLRHGGKEWPLAPYLRKKLRLLIGRDERTPDEVLEEVLEELLPVQNAAQNIADEIDPHNTKIYGQIYKKLLMEKGEARVSQMEARERIFKKREAL